MFAEWAGNLDSISSFLDAIMPGLASAAITGLVVAPATASLVEYFRASSIRKKRRPLLKRIEEAAVRFDNTMLAAFSAATVFEEIGFKIEKFHGGEKNENLRASLASMLRDDFDHFAEAMQNTKYICQAFEVLPDEIDNTLALVTPHLFVDQVGDLIEYSAALRQVTQPMSQAYQRLNELTSNWVYTDLTKEGEDWYKKQAEEIADIADDIIRFGVRRYGRLGEPPTRFIKKNDKPTRVATGEPSLRERVAQHFAGSQLKRQFPKKVDLKLEGLTVEDKLVKVWWLLIEI